MSTIECSEEDGKVEKPHKKRGTQQPSNRALNITSMESKTNKSTGGTSPCSWVTTGKLDYTEGTGFETASAGIGLVGKESSESLVKGNLGANLDGIGVAEASEVKWGDKELVEKFLRSLECSLVILPTLTRPLSAEYGLDWTRGIESSLQIIRALLRALMGGVYEKTGVRCVLPKVGINSRLFNTYNENRTDKHKDAFLCVMVSYCHKVINHFAQPFGESLIDERVMNLLSFAVKDLEKLIMDECRTSYRKSVQFAQYRFIFPISKLRQIEDFRRKSNSTRRFRVAKDIASKATDLLVYFGVLSNRGFGKLRNEDEDVIKLLSDTFEVVGMYDGFTGNDHTVKMNYRFLKHDYPRIDFRDRLRPFKWSRETFENLRVRVVKIFRNINNCVDCAKMRNNCLVFHTVERMLDNLLPDEIKYRVMRRDKRCVLVATRYVQYPTLYHGRGHQIIVNYLAFKTIYIQLRNESGQIRTIKAMTSFCSSVYDVLVAIVGKHASELIITHGNTTIDHNHRMVDWPNGSTFYVRWFNSTLGFPGEGPMINYGDGYYTAALADAGTLTIEEPIDEDMGELVTVHTTASPLPIEPDWMLDWVDSDSDPDDVEPDPVCDLGNANVCQELYDEHSEYEQAPILVEPVVICESIPYMSYLTNGFSSVFNEANLESVTNVVADYVDEVKSGFEHTKQTLINTPVSFWEEVLFTSAVGMSVSYLTNSPLLGCASSLGATVAINTYKESVNFDHLNTTHTAGICRTMTNVVLALGKVVCTEDPTIGLSDCFVNDTVIVSSNDCERYGNRAAAMLSTLRNVKFVFLPDPRDYCGPFDHDEMDCIAHDSPTLISFYDPLMTGTNLSRAEFCRGSVSHLPSPFIHSTIRHGNGAVIEYTEQTGCSNCSVSVPKFSRPIEFHKDSHSLNYIRHRFLGWEIGTTLVRVEDLRVGDFKYVLVIPLARWYLLGGYVRWLIPHGEPTFFDPSTCGVDNELIIIRRVCNGNATTSLGRYNSGTSCVLPTHVFDKVCELTRTHVSINTVRGAINAYCKDKGIDEPDQSMDSGMMSSILRSMKNSILSPIKFTGCITNNVTHSFIRDLALSEPYAYNNLHGHCCSDFFNLDMLYGGAAFSLPNSKDKLVVCSGVAGRVTCTTTTRMKPFLPGGLGVMDGLDITAHYCLLGKEFMELFMSKQRPEDKEIFIAEPEDLLRQLKPEQVGKHHQVSIDPDAFCGQSQAHIKDEVGNGKHARIITEVRSFYLQVVCSALSKLFKENCPAYCFKDNQAVDEQIQQLLNGFIDTLIVVDLKTYDASQNAAFKIFEALMATMPFNECEHDKIKQALADDIFNTVKLYGKDWKVRYNSLLSKMSGSFSTSIFNTIGLIMVVYVAYRTKRGMSPEEAMTKCFSNAHGGDDAIIADMPFEDMCGVGKHFGMMFTLENTVVRSKAETHKPMKFLGREISCQSINNPGLSVVSVIDAARRLKTLPIYRKNDKLDLRVYLATYPDRSKEDLTRIAIFVSKMADIMVSGRNTPILYPLAVRTMQILNKDRNGRAITYEEIFRSGYDRAKWSSINPDCNSNVDEALASQRLHPDDDENEFIESFDAELESMEPPRYFKHQLFHLTLEEAESIEDLMHMECMVQFEDSDETDNLRKAFSEKSVISDEQGIVDELMGAFDGINVTKTLEAHDLHEETDALFNDESRTCSKEMRRAIGVARHDLTDVFGQLITGNIVPKTYIDPYILGGERCGFSRASGYRPTTKCDSFDTVTIICSRGEACLTRQFWNDENGQRCGSQGEFYFQAIDVERMDREGRNGRGSKTSFAESLPTKCWACVAAANKRKKDSKFANSSDGKRHK